jgi:uncharacterized protein (TIGR01244 family)
MAARTFLLAVVMVGGGCARELRGPQPANLEGVKNLSQDGEVYVSGEVAPEAYPTVREQGVMTVVDLRQTDQKSADVEQAARAAGLNYVALPMPSDQLSAEQARAFLDAMKNARGGVLIQCGSANRAGAMYGLYSASCGVDASIAQEWARQAGMKNPDIARDLEQRIAETAQAEK